MIYYKFTQLESIYYFCEIDYVFKTEQWKDIPDYEGMYSVSDLGRVKSLNRIVTTNNSTNRFYKERILKQVKADVYLIVSICREPNINKSKAIHQLVATAFLNHIPCGYELIVDHIDNNPFNNKLINLQIVTQRKNSSKDKFRKNYTSKYTGVFWDKYANKWISRMTINNKKKYLGSFINEYDAHLAYQNKLKEITL